MYSLEEKANFLTHFFGLVLALGALIYLLQVTNNDPDGWRRVSFIIYGASIVILFASSTLYHASSSYPAKRILQVVDHVAIYFLIAGTYTPFLLVPLRDEWGCILLTIIWGLAIIGSILKFWFTGKYKRISTAIYLGMGWLSLVAIKPMLASVPMASLIWLLIGGIFYTAGVYFYNKTALRYHHAVWHLFVLAGSASHFISISRYL
jgi:hemolysin III